jgi:hypothetical protein
MVINTVGPITIQTPSVKYSEPYYWIIRESGAATFGRSAQRKQTTVIERRILD